MPQHYQVVIKDDGKVYINTLDGSQRIDPEKTAEIAAQLATTAQEPSYVYIGYQASTGRHKIGLSIEPPRRAKELDIEILHTVKCKAWGDHSARALEKILHNFFKLMGGHIEGEWFNLTKLDLYNLETIEQGERPIYHEWYARMTRDLKSYLEAHEKTPIPNPFGIQIYYSNNFWKLSMVKQFAFAYWIQSIANAAEKTNEKLLAKYIRDWITSVQDHFIEELEKEEE